MEPFDIRGIDFEIDICIMWNRSPTSDLGSLCDVIYEVILSDDKECVFL